MTYAVIPPAMSFNGTIFADREVAVEQLGVELPRFVAAPHFAIRRTVDFTLPNRLYYQARTHRSPAVTT